MDIRVLCLFYMSSLTPIISTLFCVVVLPAASHPIHVANIHLYENELNIKSEG